MPYPACALHSGLLLGTVVHSNRSFVHRACISVRTSIQQQSRLHTTGGAKGPGPAGEYWGMACLAKASRPAQYCPACALCAAGLSSQIAARSSAAYGISWLHWL